MCRKLLMLFSVMVMLGGGVVTAAEVGLTSVLYPENKQVKLPISGTQRAPAANISGTVRFGSGQSSITLDYKQLPPAVLFGGDIVSYTVWAVSPDGVAENLGGIANDGVEKGKMQYSTPKRDFAMIITAEPIATVRGPGALVVFFSGTPSDKNVTLKAFTYGGLAEREEYISSDRESIAGMTYTPEKKRSLPLIQAEKAVELLDRFEAGNYDRKNYDGAVATLAEAQGVKGGKQVDAAQRSLVMAGQALSQTARMMEAEAEAAKQARTAAEKQALIGEGAVLAAELGATSEKLAQTESRLARTESELETTRVQLKRANAQASSLTAQRMAMKEQLEAAVGQMATYSETDRGYVVSLSGTAFASGKSELTTDAKYVLAKLAGLLLTKPKVTLILEGHTDSTGEEEFNRKLSLDRANAVEMFISEMGVDSASMNAEGFGPDRPIAPNDTIGGRAKNRRVDIVLLKK
ncbi:MAG: OmpA family protein [Acidobacteria bacterium]|nr:OmpA family protein [Acidobacteriota bacterium]